LALVGGDARSPDDCAPVLDIHIDALLLQGRNVDALNAGGRRDRDRPELAGLDLAFKLAIPLDANGDAPAEKGCQRLAAA